MLDEYLSTVDAPIYIYASNIVVNLFYLTWCVFIASVKLRIGSLPLLESLLLLTIFIKSISIAYFSSKILLLISMFENVFKMFMFLRYIDYFQKLGEGSNRQWFFYYGIIHQIILLIISVLNSGLELFNIWAYLE